MRLSQDVRYGVRVLLKSPGFLLVSVVSLALGIGANTTIFTMVNSVLLQPLPVQNPAELMYIYGTDSNNREGLFAGFLPVSYPNFVDYRAENEAFVDVGVYGFPMPVTLGGGGKPAPMLVQLVTASYFSLLGVAPAIGRMFLAEEDQTPGTHAVAVLNYQYWQRRFGGDPSVIGNIIRLNGHPFTVVGVAARGFAGTIGVVSPDAWLPVMSHPFVIGIPAAGGPLHTNRRLLSFFMFGRLKPSVPMSQAESQLQTVGRRLEQEYPNENSGRNVGVLPLTQATIPPPMRRILVQGSGLLMAVVGLVLLIACANIANLMMARATARRREYTVRLALGCARSRLVTQLLIESLLVAIPGGILALLVAVAGRNLLLSLMPPVFNAGNLNLPIDATVFAFTFILAIASGILFGVVPALNASRSDLAVDLKDRTGATAQGRLGNFISGRNVLVAFQVALSVVSLASAGLFLRSLTNAQKIDLGFNVDHLVVAQYDVTSNGYDESRGKEFHRQAVERVRNLPGVEAVTLASAPPLFPPFQRSVFPEGQDAGAARNGVLAYTNTVVPGYFDAVGIPLVKGRDFTDRDREEQTLAVVINEAMARRFWPDQDPLGKRFRFYGDNEFRNVVGIVKNVKVVFVGEDPQPLVYIPLEQNYQPAMTLFARTSGRLDVLKGMIEREMQSLDRDIALTQLFTAPEVLDNSLWPPRMAATLLSIFGTIALILASVGIYGVMSYSVNRRTSEIGIRMALGAERRDVMWMVLRQGMVLVLIGLGTGLACAIGVSSVLSGLLYGVGTADLPTFAGTAAILLLVAVVANFLPARRATRVDPVASMKYE
jgi:predicted permease